jgi:hypothetical protein
MRDDASLRRLAEIGIDVYLLRGTAERASSKEAVGEPMVDPAARAAHAAAPGIVVLAGAQAPRGARLLRDVERAFGLARIRCRFSARADEATLADAAALVVFGDSHARAAGACLPAQRQREIGWVVVAEPATFAGHAAAKRALWSELKRIMRPLLGTDPAQPR